MKDGKRHLIQAAAALVQNPHLENFFTGGIYRGPTKRVCVPGLNCYSCPGAAGACPIGSLQAVIGGRQRNVSYYVTGAILLFGVLFGRLICGFLCPFGLVQDLLHKLPSPKPRLPRRLDRPLRWGKYVSLAAVVTLPALLTDPFGIGDPVFCKYVCPAGTLEGGIPILLHNETLRSAVGFLFSWKMGILLAVVLASVLLYRPFCKYLCPLGAAYGLLNRCSLYRMEVDPGVCTGCGACSRRCKMGVDVTGNINSPECIRCGACQSVCRAGAIRSGFLRTPKPAPRRGS
jgi:ferredoxin-type protein NapH